MNKKKLALTLGIAVALSPASGSIMAQDFMMESEEYTEIGECENDFCDDYEMNNPEMGADFQKAEGNNPETDSSETKVDSQKTGVDFPEVEAELFETEVNFTDAADHVDQEKTTTEAAMMISSAEDFHKIREHLNGTYILTNDIDFTDVMHQPIGTDEEPFCGVLIGNGYSIKNLEINISDETKEAGLFGVIKDACIMDLMIEYHVSGDREAGWNVGAIAGYSQNSVIEQCILYGTELDAVGFAEDSKIEVEISDLYSQKTDADGTLAENESDSETDMVEAGNAESEITESETTESIPDGEENSYHLSEDETEDEKKDETEDGTEDEIENETENEEETDDSEDNLENEEEEYSLSHGKSYISEIALVYSGAEMLPEMEIYGFDGERNVILLEEDVDYEVTYYNKTLESSDVINVGEIAVTVTGKNQYHGEIHSSYWIVPLCISEFQ